MKRLFHLLLLLTVAMCSRAEKPVVQYEASLTANASTGDFAPYLLSARTGGRYTSAYGIWHNGLAKVDLDLTRRFSWAAGVEYQLGYGSGANYRHYADNNWSSVTVRPAAASLRQLYGMVKFRGVFLSAGMKDAISLIVDSDLSSGDITLSDNARAIPEVAVGFIDFQDIPFTNGWVQIEGRVAMGKMTDSDFKQKMFNDYKGIIATDLYTSYKRCYFRTKPTQPFSITVGMQVAGLYGGKTVNYSKGNVTSTQHRGFSFKQFRKMLIPSFGEDYWYGSTLGSWDFAARYRLRSGGEIKAYFEWPWEDGSGIGRRNGWDGLWGLCYTFAHSGWVNKLLFEYLDFTNQSGPLHFAPDDYPGTSLGSQATGGDNYYNNGYYGPWANYGMGIGTPFLVAPLYNSNGIYEYLHNRARGFHFGIEGSPTERFSYKALISWQRAGGSGRMPAPHRMSATSAMVGIDWTPVEKIPSLALKAQVAFDAGKLRGNNFGALVGIKYSGKLTF